MQRNCWSLSERQVDSQLDYMYVCTNMCRNVAMSNLLSVVAVSCMCLYTCIHLYQYIYNIYIYIYIYICIYIYVYLDVSETVYTQCGRQRIHPSGSTAIVFRLGPCVLYLMTVKYTSEVPPMSKHNIMSPVCVSCSERERERERKKKRESVWQRHLLSLLSWRQTK